MKKLLVAPLLALILIPTASASLSTRVARLEAKTRSLQGQVTTLKSQNARLGDALICSSALNSDLTMIGFDAIDVLFGGFGTAGPFLGAKGFSDNGACSAIGVNRTPYVVTHAYGQVPSMRNPILAAQRLMTRVALLFAARR